MPLDHFVSQVHLRRFISPALGNRFHAIRKADLFYFTPTSNDVCRLKDNSTNPYLPDERAIEEFLRSIEPRYNYAVDTLSTGDVDNESVYVISGFLAYVLTCSPAAMRHQSTPLNEMLKMATLAYDRQGLLPRAPAELGNRTISELLTGGDVQLDIDAKYPQALGISSVLELTNSYGNGSWEVLVNENYDCPFFTSDFPVATIPTPEGIAYRVVPLTPGLAIRILPRRIPEGTDPDFRFLQNRTILKRATRAVAISLNRSIVQAAESEVYFRDHLPWVGRFVERNSGYRTEVLARRIPHGRGEVLHTKTEIRKWRS